MNSEVISTIKKEIINTIIEDGEIPYVLDNSEDVQDDPSILINNNIFRYNYNPTALKEEKAMLTIQIKLAENNNPNEDFVRVSVEFWVICHQGLMSPIPKKDLKSFIKSCDTRTDYLSILLDKKFNGASGLCYSKLRLRNNDEGVLTTNYMYRYLRFEGKCVNTIRGANL